MEEKEDYMRLISVKGFHPRDAASLSHRIGKIVVVIREGGTVHAVNHPCSYGFIGVHYEPLRE